MKICVSAPDSKLANLAILKIAQHHLNRGGTVKWYEPLFDQDADLLYISKIFAFTPDPLISVTCPVFYGGTGYAVATKLPEEIENITDIRKAYEILYPEIDYSILFTTRGCVRKCSFCCVPIKEGMIHDINPVLLNPSGKYIELLDNNFFSTPTWEKRLNFIKSFDQPINFNTGIDVRTITDNQASALGDCKIIKVHIAWDNPKEESAVIAGIKRLIRYVSPSRITCYVLVGFDYKTIVPMDHYRIEKIAKFGITPFAMGYIDFNDPNYQKSQSVLEFCRWVNRHLFKTIPFTEYTMRTTPSKDQIGLLPGKEGV